MMKRMLPIAIIVVLMIGTAGCMTSNLPLRREIDDLELAQVIGVDKSENISGNVIITAAGKKLTDGGSQQSQGSGNSQNAGSNKAVLESAEGKTIFEAARNMQTHSDKTTFWGHLDYYLIGEDAAKENIVKYIDFFSRDHEFHIDSKIYIVKGTTAKNLIEQFNKSEFYITDKLDSLGQNVKLLDTSTEMKLFELMQSVDIHFGSARVPCIELVSREGSSGQKVPDIEINGYAIFSDLKLSSYIDLEISRGVNLITNIIGSSVVAVKDLAGEYASLEIRDAKTEVIPHFNGDELEEVTLRTKVFSNLGEIQSQKSSIYEKNFKHMEEQQSEILRNEMQRVLDTVLRVESDCLGINDGIRLKSPIKWHRIESQWIDILPHIQYHIEVESKIERSYELNEPSGYKGLN